MQRRTFIAGALTFPLVASVAHAADLPRVAVAKSPTCGCCGAWVDHMRAAGFAVDVQTGVPRVWSGIATASLAVGSVILYDGLSLSWITLLVAIGGVALAMIGGMPAMVRTRFSTPTIGREWMVGELGTAQSRIAPEGIVSVRDAPWRARTNRATPIDAAAPVRVVSIDGLLLEVEPLEGAARDHREQR